MKELKKMTKKERKAYFSAQRGSWYGLNPVTRCPKNSRAYDRMRELLCRTRKKKRSIP